MSLQDDIQQGKDRYTGARLREHDEKLGDLNGRVERLEGSEPVEVPEGLANFVAGLRAEDGVTDEMIIMAVFENYGLGVFSDREIAAALQPAPQEAEGDELQAEEPGDESGSDEDPGE